MAIDFPDSPSVNDTHTVGSVTWVWDGNTWKGSSAVTELSAIQDDIDTRKVEVSYEISTNTNLVSGGRYIVDTSSALTLTLPDTPAVGDEIQIFDATNTAETNNITIQNNGSKINGVLDTLVFDVNGGVATLIYTGTDLGWRI